MIKTRRTEDGGYAVLLTNKTGAPSVKGYIVEASYTFDNAVQYSHVDHAETIGVFLHSGVADGDEAWIVYTGTAYVFFIGSTTRGHLARSCVALDTGDEDGKAASEPFPSPPFSTDKHFAEIGHVLESRTGAGLAKVMLHFN